MKSFINMTKNKQANNPKCPRSKGQSNHSGCVKSENETITNPKIVFGNMVRDLLPHPILLTDQQATGRLSDGTEFKANLYLNHHCFNLDTPMSMQSVLGVIFSYRTKSRRIAHYMYSDSETEWVGKPDNKASDIESLAEEAFDSLMDAIMAENNSTPKQAN